MDQRIQVVAVIGSALLLLVILELVRRRRLLERYALLWLFSALVLLGLAIWDELLSKVASSIGVATPVNALFFVAFGFVLVLLLHFSLAVSRMADQTKVLAQRMALLEERQRHAEASEQPDYRAAPPSDRAELEQAELERAGRLG
jgi:hypothetical protein